MLVEVSNKEFRGLFPIDKNPFISEAFVTLNEHKQDKILRLMKEGVNSIGLLVGLKDNVLRSPFSAPFGGLHYRHENTSYEIIYNFLSDLKGYLSSNRLKEIFITLPPNIYQNNMNAKLVNAFIRLGYKMEVPDLTSFVDLKKFNGKWTKSDIAGNIRKAIGNNLKWNIATTPEEMEATYDVIFKNREGLGRNIHMSLEDIFKVKELFPVDFFYINDNDNDYVGAAVVYRGHESIAQGIFMGSSLQKRSIGVVDLMYLKIFEYYKELGFEYLDMGISSVDGVPNLGLLNFKENHNGITSLRYSFSWSINS